MNIHYGDILTKLGECTDIQEDTLPFISDKSIVEKYSDSFLERGDIIIADTAEDESVGKCTEVTNIYSQKLLAGLHTIPCRPNWKFAAGYLGYYMNSASYRHQLRPLMQGIKVTSISRTALLSTGISYPQNSQEQTAIGNFFRTLDDAITLHRRKLDALKELKKGYLQQMFPQAGESVPRVRFAGFAGEWERRKLGELTERVARKNSNLESTLPLTISAQYGLVDQTEFFDKQIASRDVSGYFLIKNGEFAYNKSYSNGYPWGAIKRLDKYAEGVLSTLYIVFAPTNVESEFLAQYYESSHWHTEVAKRAAEGARNHGLLNIAPSDFFDTEILLPLGKEEQTSIGSFFRTLDEQITAQTDKLEQLKQLKAAYLQKMFI